MTIAQLVSDIKCELACNYVSVLDEKEYGINCKNKEYDFSSVELELFFLEKTIHYFYKGTTGIYAIVSIIMIIVILVKKWRIKNSKL